MSSAQNSNGGRAWGGQVPKKRSAPPCMGDAEVSCLGQLWQKPEAGAFSAAGCLACLSILSSSVNPLLLTWIADRRKAFSRKPMSTGVLSPQET